ncbi:MAG TPA: hypothetical protein VIF15_12555 [Polyangiaceae bacterium]
MPAPSASAAPSAASAPSLAAPAPTPTPAPTESVERPDPGLARGRWESPAWTFWLVAVLALAGGLTWLAVALRARRTAR